MMNLEEWWRKIKKEVLSEEQLIDHIAKIWIENGADSEGYGCVMHKILERIRDLEAMEEKE